MRLVSARVQNYRSIADQTIDFEPRCRILVGVNESGKSNILRALALLDAEATWTSDDVREFHASEPQEQDASVFFKFALEDAERIELRDNFVATCPGASAGRKLIESNGKQLSVSQVFERLPWAYYEVDLINETREFQSDTFEGGETLLDNWLKPSAQWPKGEQITTKDGKSWARSAITFVHDSMASQFPEGHLTPALIEDLNNYLVDAISEFAEENCPGCLYWTYSDANLLPASLDLDGFAANPASCVPLQQMFKLAGFKDIAGTITEYKKRQQGIRNLLAKVSDIATKHVRKVWADYRDLEIELAPNGSGIDAHIRDKHNRFGFARRSDGFKRFISFLLLVSSQDKLGELTNTLFIQDEPDTGLHPSGTRHLRDELIRIAKKNYVAVSTHSIFMIDRDEVRRHLIVSKEDEVTTAEEAGESNIKDEEVIYNALGYSMFETLNKRNVIFEGWRDKQLFIKAAAYYSKSNKKIERMVAERGLCHSNGVGDIERVTSVLELANRRWIVVSDADEPAKREQARYEGVGTWYRYDELDPSCAAVTGEDFIAPDAFLAAVTDLSKRDPRLANGKPFVPTVTDRVDRIRKWMAANGLDTKETKQLLDALKSALFADLSGSDIVPEYRAIVEAILSNS